MALYGFKLRFVAPILAGEKRHTIRAKRKRQTRVGELLYLYCGLRQKGAFRILPEPVKCTKVDGITIGLDGVIWVEETDRHGYITKHKLEQDECELLARCDGFHDFVEMMQFWKGRTPFKGDIIHWEFTGDRDGEVRETVPVEGMHERGQRGREVLQRQMPHSRLESAQRGERPGRAVSGVRTAKKEAARPASKKEVRSHG